MGRSRTERISDAKRRLDHDANIWIVTSTVDGDPHVIPLSLAWHDGEIHVVTAAASRTALNILERPGVRAHLDSSAEVLVIDGRARSTPLRDCDPEQVVRLVDRIGWNPFDSDNDWVLISITPIKMQSWNGPGEISGRTIMNDGEWLEG